jgi:glycosyltransferase involved in cell wall biosynthesis
LYVNIPITRKTFYSNDKNPGVQKHCDIIRNKGNVIEQINDHLWQFFPTTLIESINFIPFTRLFQAANRINNKRFAADIKTGIKALGLKDIILFNDNDIYNGFFLKEFLKPDAYIYYMRDFLQGFPYWKTHTTKLEPKLIHKADLVVTNSLYYEAYCQGYNQNSFYIGQGCKLDLFDPKKVTTIPQDLADIPSPKIGYIGAVDSSRLDPAILKIIAEANPDWNLVVVGPEDNTFQNSDLHKMSNIHFLGLRPIDQLPAYMKGLDLCINPQKINIVTQGNYPLKIDEYLAMGKPVVATKTKAMEIFQDFTNLAKNPEEYPALIKKALEEHTTEDAKKGILFANSHTWQNCITELGRVFQLLK